MKKLSLLALILIITCTVSMAQPRAIGGRLSWGIGPSYQHQIGEKNMIQVDVDFIAYGLWGVQTTATYNWIIPLKSWDVANWNLYAGVGIGGGYEWWGTTGMYFTSTYPTNVAGKCGFVGVAGMVGMEWNFKFPLQLFIEYRPVIGTRLYQTFYSNYTQKGVGTSFYYDGLWATAFAVGARYKFGGK